jgi:protein-tyrosine sulfotransferase
MSNKPVDMSRMIFVGGPPRSGTTLVQRILASHSWVYGGPEFDLIPEVVKLRNQFHSSVDSGRISKYLSHQEVDELFARFVAQAFSYKLNKLDGKKYVSEKTPANVTVFPELAEIFPDAHLVFVLRDPRAVVASMLQVGKRFRKDGKRGPNYTMDARGAVEYVNACWAAGSQATGQHRNVHVIYYEDIVASPEQSIRRLVAELGMPFERQMVEMGGYDMPEFKAGEEYWYSKERLRAPITYDSGEAWRGQLTSYQDYLICKRIRRVAEVERYNLKPARALHYRLVDFVGASRYGLRDSAKKMIRKVGSFVYGHWG